MRKLTIGIALLLLLSGCGSSKSAVGSRDAGDCTTIGEIIEINDEFAICLKIENTNKYLIEGPVIEDINLLAGIKRSDFYLSDQGQALMSEFGWTYQDLDGIDYETINLKRYIADKPEWNGVAALILAEEATGTDVDYVLKNYCPKDPEAYCAPKTMSEQGVAELDRTSAIWGAAVTALNDKLELIGVAIEGKYQVDGLKAAEFAMKSLNLNKS